MLVKEVWTNGTEGYRIGDSGYYEPWTTDTGQLFKAYQKEFGRCTSKVYVDKENGAQPIVWEFEKLVSYTDTGEPYLQLTWVVLHNTEPIKHYSYDYHYLS